MDDADCQALADLRRQLIGELPPPADFAGIEKHRLLVRSFHGLVRLPQRDPEHRQGRAWTAFFAAYVPHLGPHGAILWDDWRTSLLKDGAPGRGVVIGERAPEAHGKKVRAAEGEEEKVFVDLESAITDFIAALDSLLAACEKNDELRATVLHNWRRSQWTVRPFTLGTETATAYAGPPVPGTVPVQEIPTVFSASASASFAKPAEH